MAILSLLEGERTIHVFLGCCLADGCVWLIVIVIVIVIVICLMVVVWIK